MSSIATRGAEAELLKRSLRLGAAYFLLVSLAHQFGLKLPGLLVVVKFHEYADGR